MATGVSLVRSTREQSSAIETVFVAGDPLQVRMDLGPRAADHRGGETGSESRKAPAAKIELELVQESGSGLWPEAQRRGMQPHALPNQTLATSSILDGARLTGCGCGDRRPHYAHALPECGRSGGVPGRC